MTKKKTTILKKNRKEKQARTTPCARSAPTTTIELDPTPRIKINTKSLDPLPCQNKY
jgi:hypothetical protein